MKTMTTKEERLAEALASGGAVYLTRAEVVEIGLATGLTRWTIRTLLENEAERVRWVPGSKRKKAAKGRHGPRRREAMYKRKVVLEMFGLDDRRSGVSARGEERES